MWFSISRKIIAANSRSIYWRDILQKTCRYYAGTAAMCGLWNRQCRKETARLLLIHSSKSSLGLTQSLPTTLKNNVWALKPQQRVYVLPHHGRVLSSNKHRHELVMTPQRQPQPGESVRACSAYTRPHVLQTRAPLNLFMFLQTRPLQQKLPFCTLQPPTYLWIPGP